ncbi:DUF6058 family natural product biosynthesis protein [Embleya sp. NBC_00896]|uniref:DUF6058 family natural product biosynthesis protein n=1 Tax=Embleya sp. NBC_00896 TaxID=2975961 RepID=UPI00386D139A
MTDQVERTTTTAARAVAERYREVNGDHPMSAADDAYVTREFVTLPVLCATLGLDPDQVRGDMLEGLLPLPSYLRSDGAEMVPADLFALAEAAGGTARLRSWFVGHWADPAEAEAEWDGYLSGQYVCLRAVSPATIRRKGELMTAIDAALAAPAPDAAPWLARLHWLVDGLDALEPDFTASASPARSPGTPTSPRSAPASPTRDDVRPR